MHDDLMWVLTVDEPTTSHLVDKSPGELHKKQYSDEPIQGKRENEKPQIDDVRSQGPTAQRLNQL